MFFVNLGDSLARQGGVVQRRKSLTYKPAPLIDFFSVYGKNPVKNRTDKNSTSAALSGFAGAIDDVPLPDGISLRSEEEHVIWNQFTRARAREDWRDMDLILLAKVVRMEADIREHQSTLDRSGVLIQNKRGTLIPNPLLAVVDNLERRQLAVIRSMSLNQLSSDPRTLNGSAKNENQARELLHDLGVEGLIAMPTH